MKASIMNGQGAGVKAEQVKLEAMENGKAANKAPKAGADGKTVDPSGYDEKTKQKAERIVEKEKYKDVNFWQEHKKELWEMLPFLWPKDRPFIKLCMVLSVFFLLCSKLCNVASPIALKYAVDAVVKGEFSVEAILAYGLLRFAGQFFNELKDNAFAYVSTHASRKISLRTFTHVMGLSLRFHINRKTGSVIRACSRGSESFAALLRYVSFQVAPIFLEVALVCVYLWIFYTWYFGIITFMVIVVYIAFTVPFTEWRNKFRRQQTDADDVFNQKATDSLLNFETVKLFCAEPHIAHVYDVALAKSQKASLRTTQSLTGLNMGQAVIITVGITLSLALAAKEVQNGNMTVGDFVLVNTYILQLYVPLNFLGTYYRMIKQCMVDVEAMFRLMKENNDVPDDDGATDLVLHSRDDARVEFEGVKFAYSGDADGRQILRGVSFAVEPGQKVAIVGSSGAGKSTIGKLLYRLYDIYGGAVLINGQDISRITQRSVRCAIGIVPQDCVLFNDTIEYNIAFGKLGTSTMGTIDEVKKAAKAAQFSKFVDEQCKEGYQTLVGERGLRLSGGEKQRVAIARALLKDPPIMIYDEATSSLDTHTEKEIMLSINEAAKGRTNLVIAHRLSTIMDSNAIIVLKDGEVAERGDHPTLYEKPGGLYRTMWDSQLQNAMASGQSASNMLAAAAGKKKAPTMGLYDVDQMILARHQGMWYEGKVVDVEPAAGATGEARYKIHFQGWNSRWDYWEKQSSGDLMADTEENRAKNMGKGKGKTNANAGKDGAKDAGKDAGKKRPSKDDGKKGGNKKAKTGSKKGGDATDTPTPDAPTPDAPPELARLRFNLSTSLKRELIAGWEKITREDKLVHLPRSVTVSTILERFESDSRAKARSPEQAEMAGEITSGLRAYFDRSLRAVLLYTQEHAQADELLTGGKAPCDVYGGEHLLRLFVKLPELVPLGDMDQDATHLLHMRLQDFLRWLQRNAASSFGCGYVSVKDGKTVLEPERTKEYVAPQEKEKKGSSPETTKRSVEPEPVAA